MTQERNGIANPSIGIITTRFGTGFYGQMLDGVCNLLIRIGYNPLILPTYSSAAAEMSAIDLFLQHDLDGIIYQGDLLSDDQLRLLLEKYPQLVVMARCVEGFENRCVYVDNAHGARQVVRHLVENGHVNVAMVAGPRSKIHEVSIRTDVFINELKANGLKLPAELIAEGDFTFKSGMDAMRKLLSVDMPFTAVFAQNDDMAFGVMASCEEKGLRVPRDISIVGFDDLMQLAHIISPELTTVRQPMAEVGNRAAQLLHSSINCEAQKNPFPQNYGRILPILIERGSVALLQKTQLETGSVTGTLTNRETECLKWIASGKTSGEIATILSITESTVNFHLKNILVKLDASNRVHAVTKAIVNGLLKF